MRDSDSIVYEVKKEMRDESSASDSSFDDLRGTSRPVVSVGTKPIQLDESEETPFLTSYRAL